MCVNCHTLQCYCLHLTYNKYRQEKYFLLHFQNHIKIGKCINRMVEIFLWITKENFNLKTTKMT